MDIYPNIVERCCKIIVRRLPKNIKIQISNVTGECKTVFFAVYYSNIYKCSQFNSLKSNECLFCDIFYTFLSFIDLVSTITSNILETKLFCFHYIYILTALYYEIISVSTFLLQKAF